MTSTLVTFTRPTGALTEMDLCGWIGQARPGDVLEYHRGFLALDIVPVASRLAPEARQALAAMARRALWAAEQDLVHLVQCRNGPDDFSYLAVARPKPKHAPASVAELLLAEAA